MLLPSFSLPLVRVFAFVVAGDRAGSLDAVDVDVVDLDDGYDVAMLLTVLLLVTGNVGCSYLCW
mgnify:CR=1 FL=1